MVGYRFFKNDRAIDILYYLLLVTVYRIAPDPVEAASDLSSRDAIASKKSGLSRIAIQHGEQIRNVVTNMRELFMLFAQMQTQNNQVFGFFIVMVELMDGMATAKYRKINEWIARTAIRCVSTEKGTENMESLIEPIKSAIAQFASLQSQLQTTKTEICELTSQSDDQRIQFLKIVDDQVAILDKLDQYMGEQAELAEKVNFMSSEFKRSKENYKSICKAVERLEEQKRRETSPVSIPSTSAPIADPIELPAENKVPQITPVAASIKSIAVPTGPLTAIAPNPGLSISHYASTATPSKSFQFIGTSTNLFLAHVPASATAAVKLMTSQHALRSQQATVKPQTSSTNPQILPNSFDPTESSIKLPAGKTHDIKLLSDIDATIWMERPVPPGFWSQSTATQSLYKKVPWSAIEYGTKLPSGN